MRNTHAQCWIRIHGLSQEYWRPKIFIEIAEGIDNPIALDEATSTRVFRHFARILVDIDMTTTLYDQILVEREGFAFFVGIE